MDNLARADQIHDGIDLLIRRHEKTFYFNIEEDEKQLGISLI
jgi:hypothetical protein